MTNSELWTLTISNFHCQHKNGWYGHVDFWIFRRHVFACSDCGEILYGKRLRDFLREKEGK